MTYVERSGVLLIADLSGHTEYLASDELSHADCLCRGCAVAARLGLKFVAHCGPFGEHSIHGMRQVIGQEVILVHRLLKNSIGLRE